MRKKRGIWKLNIGEGGNEVKGKTGRGGEGCEKKREKRKRIHDKEKGEYKVE